MRLRIAPRTIAACGVLVLVGVAVLAAALSTGAFQVPLPDVLTSLAGQGDRATDAIVLNLRLPRALTALAAGAALGAAGAVFQSITRNPLGSPDIVGFTQGASAAALVALTVLHLGTAGVAIAAVVGGAATAVLVYLLAFRGGVSGYRLVLVGIGISAMLLALCHYLLTRAQQDEAFGAQLWLVGSLNGAGWWQANTVGWAAIGLIPVAVALGGRLNVLEMGDDAATALGVPVEPTRRLAIAVAVLLSSAATACVGPVAFVALAAPHLARGVTSATGVGVLPAAAMGAVLLSASDFAAQHAFGDDELPVGVLTGAIGGCYLAWLLLRSWRKA